MAAEIVTTDTPDGQKKHVANIGWTPAKATIGIAMGKELYAIIQQAFKAQPKRFDGALHVASVDYKVQSSLNFSDAILTAMTFPKWTDSARNPRSSISNGRPSRCAGAGGQLGHPHLRRAGAETVAVLELSL